MLEVITIVIQHWGEIALAITAIGGAVATIWGFYNKFLKKKIIHPIWERFEKIDKISATLGPNGGTSLYDKVNSIDKKISVADARGASLNSVFGLVEWQSDINGQTLKINDVACRMTRRPESDFLGNNWMNVLHAEDEEAVLDEWRDSLKNQKDFRMKFRWTTSESETVFVEAVAKPVYDSGGKLHGYLGTAKINR